MKLIKLYITFFAFFACSFGLKAQVEKSTKRVVIEPYIGYLTGDFENRAFSNRATSLTAPISFGNRVEVKVTKRLSLGLDANYANVKIGWTDTYFPTTSSAYSSEFFKETVRHEKSVEKIRVMLNFKAYFLQRNNWEAYAVWGAGSKFVRQTDLITNERIEEDRVPLTQRVGVGIKHYFTNNIGCMMEVGLGGGSPIQAGLSIRL